MHQGTIRVHLFNVHDVRVAGDLEPSTTESALKDVGTVNDNVEMRVPERVGVVALDLDERDTTSATRRPESPSP
jgi:hypothetical protein